jgi:hypothetical protein
MIPYLSKAALGVMRAAGVAPAASPEPVLDVPAGESILDRRAAEDRAAAAEFAAREARARAEHDAKIAKVQAAAVSEVETLAAEFTRALRVAIDAGARLADFGNHEIDKLGGTASIPSVRFEDATGGWTLAQVMSVLGSVLELGKNSPLRPARQISIAPPQHEQPVAQPFVEQRPGFSIIAP